MLSLYDAHFFTNKWLLFDNAWYVPKICLGEIYILHQGRRQGKSLEGAKLPRGSRGQRPLAGVQGAEPLGGGQGASEADTFLVLKSW